MYTPKQQQTESNTDDMVMIMSHQSTIRNIKYFT